MAIFTAAVAAAQKAATAAIKPRSVPYLVALPLLGMPVMQQIICYFCSLAYKPFSSTSIGAGHSALPLSELATQGFPGHTPDAHQSEAVSSAAY